jgi:hypothetical protein
MGSMEEVPTINKPFFHIAERRVFVFASMQRNR